MKFTMSYCLSSVVYFICGVVVLVIVNGQSATEEDKDAIITRLRAELAQSVGRAGKLEDLLAASVDIIAELKASKPDESKFS